MKTCKLTRADNKCSKPQKCGLFSYNGGKGRIFGTLEYLINMFEPETFIDLTAGGGVMSLNIIAKNKIINDLNTELAVIYKALSDTIMQDRLIKRMQSICLEHINYEKAKEFWEAHKEYSLYDFSDDELEEAAFHSWVLHKHSRVGSDTTKECKYTHSNINKFENFQRKAMQYYGALDGATVWNKDLLQVLKELSENPDKIATPAVIYIDPVYLKNPDLKHSAKSPAYRGSNNVFKFGPDEHRKMLSYCDKLPRDKYKIIISGYESPDVYDKLLCSSEYGDWSKIYVDTLPVMCGNGKNLENGKRKTADEYLYVNFNLYGIDHIYLD